MLANFVIKSLACGGATNLLAKPATLAATSQFLEQRRTYGRIVPKPKDDYKFKYFYGRPPILTEDDYEDVADMRNELALESVRFATLGETNSPFYDTFFDRYVRYVMQYSRKPQMYHIMNEVFYIIKKIQLKKLYKLQEAEAKAKAEGREFQVDEDEANIELNPMIIFTKGMSNVKPIVITNKIKRGGATYNVPYPVDDRMSTALAMQWMHQACRDRLKPKKKSYAETFAFELMDAYHNQGKVIKRRDDMHRLAEANKAYAHYRWG